VKSRRGVRGETPLRRGRLGQGTPCSSCLLVNPPALPLAQHQQRRDDLLRDVNSYDKSVMEKISLIDSLDEDEKKSLFKIIDGLSSKKKMKDSLAKALAR